MNSDTDFHSSINLERTEVYLARGLKCQHLDIYRFSIWLEPFYYILSCRWLDMARFSKFPALSLCIKPQIYHWVSLLSFHGVIITTQQFLKIPSIYAFTMKFRGKKKLSIRQPVYSTFFLVDFLMIVQNALFLFNYLKF